MPDKGLLAVQSNPPIKKKVEEEETKPKPSGLLNWWRNRNRPTEAPTASYGVRG